MVFAADKLSQRWNGLVFPEIRSLKSINDSPREKRLDDERISRTGSLALFHEKSRQQICCRLKVFLIVRIVHRGRRTAVRVPHAAFIRVPQIVLSLRLLFMGQLVMGPRWIDNLL